MSSSPSESDRLGAIQVRGARENNLQNISVDIPRRRITVFTGVSGSGKSSLVFDTIAAESLRLLNETFPTFVQNFLPRYGQPDFDVLSNLSTAIIVDQQRMGGNPRSTLGTATDIYTLLRILFSRLGRPTVPHALALSFNDPMGMCPECEDSVAAPRLISMHCWIRPNPLKKAQSVFQRSTWVVTICTRSSSPDSSTSKGPSRGIRKRSGTTFFTATTRSSRSPSKGKNSARVMTV